ncbi:glycoside hydrolase family 2 protein [Rhizobium sp. CNPSo 3464]|uniref:glycoside hydrolase family 2 protein n=1 Tax=Rhizobium sp. CNPSo 3464 TaxID=3021406 RepID=UPI00254A3FBB|nr:glycoside hydrolase family 2 protein [Rhizobium sp. CNPSo 3464]MDK4739513.1 glycoside hydrolase family 2 protein [Rhizobium sp. CNPSo 3464]
MHGRLASFGGETLLSEGWNLVLTDAGACASPSDVPLSAGFIPASVPGTVAGALEKAGLFNREHPHPLNDKDAWYLCRLVDADLGNAVLRLDGLATLCEVFLNGRKILVSESMFAAHELAVHLLGGDELALCFRALEPRLAEPGPRARWRPQMITPQGLRLVRTTLLGHMPGWCPEIHTVGPWRPISLFRPHSPVIRDLSLRPDLLEDGEGRLYASLVIEGQVGEMVLRCGEAEQAFTKDNSGHCTAFLKIPGVMPWWPHTHGTPHLHDVALIIEGVEYPLGCTGFRRLAVDRGADGQDFALVVNGERIFCRGAVWTTADIARLPGGREDYEPWLRLAAEAGMNMIRIGGTMVYETPEFFRVCDELGLLVWQDFMFANFDYPKNDKAFNAHVEAEAAQLLSGTRLSPSLAVLCGGSEMYQQAAMLGLPERFWASPIVEEILPAVVKAIRPDVPYVVNSPAGGAMPFSPNAGVTHYYGVGAYMRPLGDARRADVRFAAESLAFAHVPHARTLARHLPVPAVHSPLWKERVPRDRGASWDFEDVRDHYLRELYGFEPDRLRREDPDLYLDLSRAVTGEVAEETYAEWRRQGSGCNGALVWTLQDLLPGPGWGVIDSTGEPKPIWYALRRAFRPVQVLLTDEGTNGLDVHVINEGDVALDLDLDVVCLRDGRQSVVSGKRELSVEARGKQKIACTDLFGAFFDTTYAFRFGPPSHDVTVARLTARETGALIAEAFYFPLGRTKAFHEGEIAASITQQDGHWFLDLRSDRLVQSVQIDFEAYRAEHDWFHLSPGATRRLRLHPRAGTSAETVPTGQIRTLGTRRIVEV